MELWAIVPELTLACGFLLLLLLAPFFEGRKAGVLYGLALLILALAAALTTRMLPWPVQRVFFGTYILDPLAHLLKFYAIVASGLMLLASAEYFRQSPFYSDVPALTVVSALAAAMLAGSADLALVALFFYTLTVSTLILVALLKHDSRSNEAALKYFLFGAAATAVMLYGLSLLYGTVGRTDITAPVTSVPALAVLALSIALVGFGFKMAVAPFHMWAPDVYEGAPTPVAGFLSVITKAAAFAVVLRLLLGAFSPIQDTWRLLLEVLAAVTMTVGNIWALRQTNVKRLLAYSSIAQMGYVLVALSVTGQARSASLAAMFYLVVYLFMNVGVFFVVARLEAGGLATNVIDYSGLFRRAPAFALVMTLFLLSLAGVPPLGGYIGKLLVLQAALEGNAGWLAALMAANIVLAAYYYLRIIGAMYLHDGAKTFKTSRAPGLDAALALSLAGTVLLGVLPEPVLRSLPHVR